LDLRIFPPDGILEAVAELPLSKSESARRLVIDFIAGGAGALADASRLAECHDIEVLRRALEMSGHADSIDLGASGTALRLLAALYAATPGVRCRLTGSDSLRQRPLAPLVDALREMGASITYCVREGFAPIEIEGRRLRGGDITLDASVSSQFVSALMLASPLMESPLRIATPGRRSSSPYLKMTAGMMTAAGVPAEVDPDGVSVSSGSYRVVDADVERDWSAAAFWYEIAALTAGWVTLPGLREKSLQGDSLAASLFERLGVITEFTAEGAGLSATPDLFSRLEADMSDTPDMVPALAVTAALAGIPFELSGVANLRHKECDRLAALRDELAKIGIPVTIEKYDDLLRWDGTRLPVREIPVFDSHADHRMAMALAPVAVFIPGTVIKDAGCVAKSYPGFWQQLQQAGFVLADPDEPMPDPQQQ